MKQWLWLILVPAIFGCINGAPLPPTPTSSLAVLPKSDRAAEDAEYIQLAQSYMRTEGKDPTQATYKVHRALQHDDQSNDPSDGPATVAVVEADFLNGMVWEIEIKTNGDVARRANR